VRNALVALDFDSYYVFHVEPGPKQLRGWIGDLGGTRKLHAVAGHCYFVEIMSTRGGSAWHGQTVVLRQLPEAEGRGRVKRAVLVELKGFRAVPQDPFDRRRLQGTRN